MSAATATIVAGIAAASTIGGSVIASQANKSAAKTQAKSTADALAYEKERDVYARSTEANRYGTMMGQNAPYVQSGHAANTQMSSLLGLPQQPTWQGPGAGGAPMAQPGGQMVSLRAPDGTVKQVPAEHADHYLQKGAQRV